MTTKKELTPAEEEKFREAQRLYNKQYYEKNRKTILARKKKWRKENPEKVKESIQKHWLRKAEQEQL